MTCTIKDNILSTTILYEGFVDYSEVFKFSQDTINKLNETTNKYKNNSTKDSKKSVYLTEYIFRFEKYTSIKKLIYKRKDNNFISYELIDLSHEKEKIILSKEEVDSSDGEIEILLKSIKVDKIKLKIKGRKNLLPRISDIQIIA